MKKEWAQIAKNYAKSATQKENRHKFNKWMRLACKRFLSDLERAKKNSCGFYFDPAEVDRVCEFISNLPHVEGSWGSKTISLAEFQVFFLANLFGFRKPDGSRRFTSALFAIARKNAKSTLAAAVGLYCLTMENENGPQIISAATTGDQARIVFNVAQKMVSRTKPLCEAFNLEPFTRAIASYDNGGLMRAINAKASTQDGLNPSCAILDEIHAHKSHDLLNVIQSAAGARKNPLFLFTTTEGYETPGPWPETRKFAQQVLEGLFEADHFLALIFSIDDDDNEFDEKVWIKANPLIDRNDVLLAAIRKDAAEAKSMPGRHAEFLIKRVNRQSSTSRGWIDLMKWKACGGIVDLEELKEWPCYGALDLASTRDLTSFRLVWQKNGTIYTHGWRWVPRATVQIRIQRNLVPYGTWVNTGHIIETPGEVTDYDAVFNTVLRAAEDFKLIKVVYDPWNAAQLSAKLQDNGIEMEQFIQGPKSYHPPMKFFEESYYDGRFRHNGDPVLTWCASNIVTRTDANMNMAPDKKRSADKIDDMTALLMAVGASISVEDEGDFDAFLSDPLMVK
jgi:phage terminase large subunit-like protein